jgi:competence ComEA-like helix-hairpin-helix protein
MWGREMRAGLVFVLASVLVGGAFREWKRSHEVRFEDLVADLASRYETGLAEDSGAGPGASMEAGGPSVHGRGPAAVRGPALIPSRIDLDHATARDLEKLPGIGPALAARIVADRADHGPFRTPGVLLRVRGIGPRTLDRIRPYLEAPAGAADSGSPIAN